MHQRRFLCSMFHVHSINLMRKKNRWRFPTMQQRRRSQCRFHQNILCPKINTFWFSQCTCSMRRSGIFLVFFFFGESFYKWNGVYVVWAMPLSTRLCLHNVPLHTAAPSILWSVPSVVPNLAYIEYTLYNYTLQGGRQGGPGNPNFWINEIKCVFNKHKIKVGITCSWRRLGTSKTISAVPEAMF